MLIQPLVLALLLSPSPANDPAPGDDWLDLDTEIDALAASTTSMGVPAHIQGRLMASYFMSQDPFLYTGSMDHASGADLKSARLRFLGGNEDWSWELSGEVANGELEVVDAWLSRLLTPTTEVTVGRFKRPVLQSSMIDSEYRMFWQRGNNGAQEWVRENGVKVKGDYGQVHALLSAMNGLDGQGGLVDNYFLSGRVEYDMIGEPFDQWEGAFGAPEGLHLGLAAVAGDEGGVANGIFSAYEFELVSGGFYLGGDMVTYDDGYDILGGVPAGRDPNTIIGTNMAGTSPFTVTTSLLFGESRYEVAGRVEVFDDDNDTSRTSLSLSIYDGVFGPRSRILIDYADVTSDDDTLKGDKVEIGYVFVLAD